MSHFIVIEGADGVGKTTHADRLAEWLREHGHAVVRLHEPTNGQWGQRIRQSARDDTRPDDPREEVRWFTEDRKEDVARNIQPALDAGTIVVLDRYFYSTAAYQGARGVPVAEILQQNRAFAPEPHLCVFLRTADADADASEDEIIEARRRITGERGDSPDAFEGLDYQLEVVRHFVEITGELRTSTTCPSIVLSTRRPADETFADILVAVADVLDLH